MHKHQGEVLAWLNLGKALPIRFSHMVEINDGEWYTGSPMSDVGGQEGSPRFKPYFIP